MENVCESLKRNKQQKQKARRGDTDVGLRLGQAVKKYLLNYILKNQIYLYLPWLLQM